MDFREIFFSDEEELFNKKLLDVNKAFTNIQQQLHLMRKPIGTRENPARTCRDLFYGHPDLKDGKIPFSFHIIKFLKINFNINNFLLSSNRLALDRSKFGYARRRNQRVLQYHEYG